MLLKRIEYKIAMKKKFITLLFYTLPLICLGQWSQIGDQINGEAEGDESGIVIDMNSDGTVMIIGAWRNDAAGNNAGNARVFEWNGTEWLQRGIDINGVAEDDLFGSAVSINASGNVVAVGAPQFGVSSTTPPGYVKVYDWDGADWILRDSDLTGTQNADSYGQAINLSADGDLITIGANLNSQIAIFSGQTKVYEWDGTTWNQIGDTINGENGNDFSGGSVFLNENGTKLFIGETAGSADGRIRTFDWDGSNWIEGAEINDTEGGFGFINDIDATGTTLLAGGMSGPMSQGINKIFEFDGTSWTQKGSTIEGGLGSDFLGFQAGAINDAGSTIILGAITGGAGYAQVFSFDGNDWVQEGDDILGEGNAVQFGRSVTMNSNGSVVAVGTRFNTEPNLNAGLVRAFENPTLNVTENQLNTISFYPNPINDQLTISTSQTIETIGIYNLLGQHINAFSVDHTTCTIDFTEKPSGTYFLKVHTNDGIETLKVIKR